MAKRKALGRGLSALFPDTDVSEDKSGFFYCPIDSISPNPYQPRQNFSGHELRELADSIKERGVIQPVLVSREGEGYQLVAGERRWRAAQKAGLDKIPAWLKEVSSAEALELALVENIQREDLNPIEEASAYRELMERLSLTQDALSKRIGKDRSTVANFLRLLKLPDNIKQDIVNGTLSTGHARVLAGINSSAFQKEIRDAVIKKSLSVRQAEALAKRFLSRKKKTPQKSEREHYFDSLAKELQKSLGTRVTIKTKGKKGAIVIEFYSDDDLDHLLDRLR